MNTYAFCIKINEENIESGEFEIIEAICDSKFGYSDELESDSKKEALEEFSSNFQELYGSRFGIKSVTFDGREV